MQGRGYLFFNPELTRSDPNRGELGSDGKYNKALDAAVIRFPTNSCIADVDTRQNFHASKVGIIPL